MPYDTFFGINILRSCTMGDRPGSLFFDPNTGDDMVEKDDLYQEEDGTNFHDQDRDEPSPDEDDEIIELFDTAEIPADEIEEDIIELTDMVEVSSDGIIELTEEAQESLADDDVLDLNEVATDENQQEDDVLELTDIAAADDAEDDGDLDLTERAEASDIDDDIIDLMEPVTEDEVVGFLDSVEIPAQDIGKEDVETADTTWEAGSDTDEDITALTDTIAEDEVIELLDTVEIPAEDMGEDSIETADTLREADSDLDDAIFDTTEAVDDFDIDEAAMDLTETVEDMEPDQEERFQEAVALPSTGYEEDKELLELIDDIQATLNDEPVTDRVSDQDGTPQADESIEADTLDKDADAYTFLDNDEVIEEGEVPESETEFVDHLGIDLTSETEKKPLEDIKPTEHVEAGIAPDVLETAVKQALTEMLADEDNPLAKAIENAVKKALGQGADS